MFTLWLYKKIFVSEEILVVRYSFFALEGIIKKHVKSRKFHVCIQTICSICQIRLHVSRTVQREGRGNVGTGNDDGAPPGCTSLNSLFCQSDTLRDGWTVALFVEFLPSISAGNIRLMEWLTFLVLLTQCQWVTVSVSSRLSMQS